MIKKINKKAIMLKFLTTLLLAIIIFLPACYVSSKFFRLSDQAKDNFIEFVNTVKYLENPNVPINSPKVALVTLDKETAIIYFEPQKEEVKLHIDIKQKDLPDPDRFFLRPSQCNKLDKSCICLFREFETTSTLGKDIIGSLENSKYLLKSKKMLCEQSNYLLRLDNCGLGQDDGVNSYTCSNGFIIEREVISNTLPPIHSYILERKTALQLIKGSDAITISEIKSEETTS